MNYLYIYKDKETGKVNRVDTQDSITNHGKRTQVDVDKRIDEYNLEENDSIVTKVEVDDIVHETIKFLLGEDEYKTIHDINNIHEDCKDLKYTFERIEDEMYDWRYTMENLVKRIKEQFKIED